MARMIAHALFIASVLSTGCASLLGLDDTSFTSDARIDGPPQCEGAPQCVFAGGRTICGVLRQTGTESGAPLRAAAPTGMICSALGSTEGPCSFTVTAKSVTDYFGNTGIGTRGEIDDCGRYVIPNVNAGLADVAIMFEPTTGYSRSTTLLLDREVVPGTDVDIDGQLVSDVTEMAWTLAVTVPNMPAPDVSSGYLVRYTDNDLPEMGVQVAVNGSAPLMNDPGTTPWAAYFTGLEPFAVMDYLAPSTQMHGTAYANVGTGTFTLEGFRMGARCKVMDLQQMPNTFIYVIANDC